MSGFESYSAGGILQVSSNNLVLRGTHVAGRVFNDFFDDFGSFPLIGGTSFPACVMDFAAAPDSLIWFRVPNNGFVVPSTEYQSGVIRNGTYADVFASSAGQASGTSKYLEVFDASGKQVFTAGAVNEIPVIKSVIRIDNYSMYTNPTSGQGYCSDIFTFNTNMPAGRLPCVLMQACRGRLVYEEAYGQWSGVILKTINGGAQIQCQVIYSGMGQPGAWIKPFVIPVADFAAF